MYTKRILQNGNVAIPKELRQALPSDKVKITLKKIEVEPGVVKDCVVLEPIGIEKEAITIYK